MYNRKLIDLFNKRYKKSKLKSEAINQAFKERFISNISEIKAISDELYGNSNEDVFEEILNSIFSAYQERAPDLKKLDLDKEKKDGWFLSNDLAGMSLYVDRFAGNLENLPKHLPYLENLGINLLHLMPIFESPEGESDGGYAVSNYRKVDPRFGTLDDLKSFHKELRKKDMYLMIDIVINHTSTHHEWAKKARAGNKKYMDYYYFYEDRQIPDQMELSMPEVFPESSPGNFSYVKELDQWVMSVFHNYQWDLNFRNPEVFIEMLNNIFFYANLGVDIIRIDAPAFIWKEMGTNCQNLPQAHKILQLIKLCNEIASPGMAILGEAIVAPAEIMNYFGKGRFATHECDFAYNATHMALQWDALATGDTRVMMAAQSEIMGKPLGTTWLNYTRCHDDIGLGYDDAMIQQAGLDPYLHRTYLKNYFSGTSPNSPAKGALFGVNPKTNDARISGTLASLCGLETAKAKGSKEMIELSIQKILLMQAHSFFLGGVPMLFYGDEVGYENDYTYLQDEAKSYDNRWMHRPVIDWSKNELSKNADCTEHSVFSGTQKLLKIRKSLPVIADKKNLYWLQNHNNAICGYLRHSDNQNVYCLFNFSESEQNITFYVLGEASKRPAKLKDLWTGKSIPIGHDHENLHFKPYQFYLLTEQ